MENELTSDNARRFVKIVSAMSEELHVWCVMSISREVVEMVEIPIILYGSNLKL